MCVGKNKTKTGINFRIYFGGSVLLRLPVTVDGMVSCGSSKRFPISLHRPFLRATNLRKPLKPACTIPYVMWRFSCHSSGVSVNSFSVSSIFFFVRSIFLLSKYGEPIIVNKLNREKGTVKSKDHLTQLCFQKITYNITEIVVLIAHKTNFFFLYAGSKIVLDVAWSTSLLKLSLNVSLFSIFVN